MIYPLFLVCKPVTSLLILDLILKKSFYNNCSKLSLRYIIKYPNKTNVPEPDNTCFSKGSAKMRGDIIYVERFPLGLYASVESRISPDSCVLDRLIFRFLTYKHYGVDIGDDKIIHFYCPSILKIPKARISLCSLEEFSRDGILQIADDLALNFSPEEIVQRAESMLHTDFDGYRVKHNNCEHFSMWCATGLRTGKQDLIQDAWNRCLGVPTAAKKKALSAISNFTFLQ